MITKKFENLGPGVKFIRADQSTADDSKNNRYDLYITMSKETYVFLGKDSKAYPRNAMNFSSGFPTHFDPETEVIEITG